MYCDKGEYSQHASVVTAVWKEISVDGVVHLVGGKGMNQAKKIVGIK